MTNDKPSRTGHSRRNNGASFRRSKGCAVCLKRRVKCDERSPSCTQCLKGNRKCYGLLSTIFLHTTPPVSCDTSIPHHYQEPGSTYAWKKPLICYDAGGSDLEMLHEPVLLENCRNKATNTDQEPTHDIFNTYSEKNGPSSSDQQHLSNFAHLYNSIVYSDGQSYNWIDHLPNMLGLDKDPLIKMCITATSLAYRGLFTNHKTSAEAYRWYGAALKRQSTLISELNNRNRIPGIDEICAPIILSLFEMVCGSPHTSPFNHLYGAAKLLTRISPSECRGGVLYSLYHTLRILMICPPTIMRNELAFGKEGWLLIPLRRYSESAIGSITDITVLGSTLLSHVNLLKDKRKSVDLSHASIPMIKTKVTELQICLNDTWLQFQSQYHGTAEGYSDHVGCFNYPSVELPKPSMSSPAYPSSTAVPGSQHGAAPQKNVVDVSYLHCSAYYSAARILVLSILYAINSASDYYEDHIRAHCEYILACAKAIDNWEYLELVIPLRVAAVLGTEEQRKEAEDAFRHSD